MIGSGFLYILALIFCGWHLIAMTVRSDIVNNLNDLPPYQRRDVRRAGPVRAVLLTIGVALAALFGREWLDSGASLAAVLGTTLFVTSLSVVFCLAVREIGEEARRKGAPKPTRRLGTAMEAVEFFFVLLLDG